MAGFDFDPSLGFEGAVEEYLLGGFEYLLRVLHYSVCLHTRSLGYSCLCCISYLSERFPPRYTHPCTGPRSFHTYNSLSSMEPLYAPCISTSKFVCSRKHLLPWNSPLSDSRWAAWNAEPPHFFGQCNNSDPHNSCPAVHSRSTCTYTKDIAMMYITFPLDLVPNGTRNTIIFQSSFHTTCPDIHLSPHITRL
jgi:hypothetical protein